MDRLEVELDVWLTATGVDRNREGCMPSAFATLGGLSMAREAMLRTDEPFGVSLVTGFVNNDDGSATYMSIVCVVREDDVLDEACLDSEVLCVRVEL